MNTVTMAPFETFADHSKRERSSEPYNAAFIKRCREKALEYDHDDCKALRAGNLQDLYRCVPFHFRGKVFDGITNFQRTDFNG